MAWTVAECGETARRNAGAAITILIEALFEKVVVVDAVISGTSEPAVRSSIERALLVTLPFASTFPSKALYSPMKNPVSFSGPGPSKADILICFF